MTDEELKSMAIAHAEWEAQFIINTLSAVIKTVAHDNFLHGYKHCMEEHEEGFKLCETLIQKQNKKGEYPG